MIEGDRYVALLRGLNVGGHHKVNMADLREMFSSPQLSFSDVQTYIQSGNVVFSTPPVSPASPTSRAMMLQDQIEVASGNDGKVDQKEFDLIFQNAKKSALGKKNDRELKKMIITVMEDTGLNKVKTGWFSDWYTTMKKDLGMA